MFSVAGLALMVAMTATGVLQAPADEEYGQCCGTQAVVPPVNDTECGGPLIVHCSTVFCTENPVYPGTNLGFEKKAVLRCVNCPDGQHSHKHCFPNPTWAVCLESAECLYHPIPEETSGCINNLRCPEYLGQGPMHYCWQYLGLSNTNRQPWSWTQSYLCFDPSPQ